MNKTIIVSALALLMGVAAVAKTETEKAPAAKSQTTAKTIIRAAEISDVLGKEDQSLFADGYAVEFRKGDRLPIEFGAEGDLIESETKTIHEIVVKRDFWISVENNSVTISLDGNEFKPISDVLTGSFSAGAMAAENGGVVKGISALLKANLK